MNSTSTAESVETSPRNVHYSAGFYGCFDSVLQSRTLNPVRPLIGPVEPIEVAFDYHQRLRKICQHNLQRCSPNEPRCQRLRGAHDAATYLAHAFYQEIDEDIIGDAVAEKPPLDDGKGFPSFLPPLDLSRIDEFYEVPEPDDDDVADLGFLVPERNTASFVSASRLVVDYPRETEPLIEGYLRRAETANIIASPKVGKSWLSLGIAMSIATGNDWLGHPVRQGKVLLIDNELRPATSASRLRRVADAIGIRLSDVGDSLAVENLRGRLTSLHDMDPYFSELRAHKFDLIILDALYRFFPSDASESSHNDFTQLYNAIDRHAEDLGCAFISIHHSSKGDQSQKEVTDVGSGAGSQSRAADAHIILRPHELADMAVLEGAVRSFPPPAPLSIKWEFPLWLPKPAIEAEVRMPKTFGEKKHAAKDKEGIREILDFMREKAEPISSSQCRDLMGTERAARLFRIADHDGLIEFVRKEKRGGRSVDLYQPIEGVTGD